MITPTMSDDGMRYWRLRPDARLAPSTLPALARSLERAPDALGYFDLQFAADGPFAVQLNAVGAHLRSRVLGLPFGDQGLFLPRALFERLGGFAKPVERTQQGAASARIFGVGAVVGNQFGSGTGRAVATGAGAVGGAVAGNAIEKRQRGENEVYRVSVRFEDGSVRDFDFQRIDDLRVGDRVKWEGGQLMRY